MPAATTHPAENENEEERQTRRQERGDQVAQVVDGALQRGLR